MSELPRLENERNDDVAARLKIHIDALMAPLTDDDRAPQTQTKKALATSTLTSALADPEMGQSTADFLVNEYENHEQENPLIRLYAFYSLIRKTREADPRANIPDCLLTLVRSEAWTYGEVDIAAAMAVIEFSVQEAETFAMIEEEAARDIPDRPFPSPIAEYVSRRGMEFQAFLRDSMLELNITASRTLAELKEKDGDQYANEASILAFFEGEHVELMEAIADGKFMTEEGQIAADLQHDRDMLAKHASSLNVLRYDLHSKLLRTIKGRMAGMAQYDCEMLKSYESRPIMLRGAIVDMFKSAAGKNFARAKHDEYLFFRSRDDVEKIKADFENQLFQTEAGRDAAKKLLGLS